MEAHPQYVTYVWLIGTGLVVVGLVLSVLVAWGSTKVGEKVCSARHTGLDKDISTIKTHIDLMFQRTEDMGNCLVRIETLLNMNKKEK